MTGTTFLRVRIGMERVGQNPVIYCTIGVPVQSQFRRSSRIESAHFTSSCTLNNLQFQREVRQPLSRHCTVGGRDESRNRFHSTGHLARFIYALNKS